VVPNLDRIAAGTINVLVLGETGVGKEVVAHALHALSPRAGGPIVCLNCCELSENLFESEVFGHERGAFTGALRAKNGLLEGAQGGTVFLDEIGEMSLPLQAKFLRVLEQKMVTRVGGLRPRPIDVRIVAATNRDLQAETVAGRFRRDLYFRLNGVSIVVPPLRDRREEIEPLARRFVTRFAEDAGRSPPSISEGVLALLRAYHWPGNVRELRNVAERAVMLCDGDVIELDHLPVDRMTAEPEGGAGVTSPAPQPVAFDSADALRTAHLLAGERARIVEALRSCHGNQTRAAEVLGMSRRTLVSRLTEYDLPRPRKAHPSRPLRGERGRP
jgi:transcriptional regulator with PAS, ATPase and Fis domain